MYLYEITLGNKDYGVVAENIPEAIEALRNDFKKEKLFFNESELRYISKLRRIDVVA